MTTEREIIERVTEGTDSDNCYFCNKPIVREAKETWKAVYGWVGGPKKDSMRMRKDIGEYAHDECVQKVMTGMPPSQVDLFDEGGYEEMLAQQREVPDLPLDEL